MKLWSNLKASCPKQHLPQVKHEREDIEDHDIDVEEDDDIDQKVSQENPGMRGLINPGSHVVGALNLATSHHHHHHALSDPQENHVFLGKNALTLWHTDRQTYWNAYRQSCRWSSILKTLNICKSVLKIRNLEKIILQHDSKKILQNCPTRGKEYLDYKQ